MNDNIRLKLIQIRHDKIAHRDELLEMKMRAEGATGESGPIDIDGMTAHEQPAIDNLSDAIARLA
ncbi:hypothetical protein [Rhizobium lusitanum]|jgi:hypothetical protein|uniref:hypothetical protein n=1 Tax=Rhizobium lusitanum TaxID=293958 RepID=UPI000DD9E1C5|nr:hypothetical protein [Rhizobium lusitanum]NTJ09307.1 hypothetical protein [Rhizobium lusitanum]